MKRKLWNQIQSFRTLARPLVVAALAVAMSAHFPSEMLSQEATRQAEAKHKRETSRKEIAGITRQPTDAARAALLDPSDTVILLLDHQTGLLQTVKDVPAAEVRTNAVALF